MKIVVIIVTYNGKQWCDRCFTSLRTSIVPVQTLVIDNASTDGTAPYIHKHFPEVILIENTENVGFGKANNQGLRYALDHGYDYVFLLNQDTWIKSNTLSIMLPIAEHHPECGIFSPMHITADEKSLYIEIEDGKTDHANALLSDCYFQTLKDIYLFHYVNAAAWLIPRATLELVGGFDPIFFAYGEDDNYLQRLQYFGKYVGLIPKAQIIHDHQDAHSSTNNSYRNTQTRIAFYTNILMPLNIRKELFSLFYKWCINTLINKNKSQTYKNEFMLLWNRRQAITHSRNQNKLKGFNWLN